MFANLPPEGGTAEAKLTGRFEPVAVLRFQGVPDEVFLRDVDRDLLSRPIDDHGGMIVNWRARLQGHLQGTVGLAGA